MARGRTIKDNMNNKIKHSWSTWNGQRSDKPYHKRPTQKQVQDIIKNKFIKIDGLVMVRDDDKTFIEVRGSTGNLYSTNTYIDVYKII